MPLHNLLCAHVKEFNDNTLKPPSRSKDICYARGLFLPSDSDRPRLVWVQCRRGRDEHSTSPVSEQDFGVLVDSNANIMPKQDIGVIVGSDSKSDINRHTILRSWTVQGNISELSPKSNRCIEYILGAYDPHRWSNSVLYMIQDGHDFIDATQWCLRAAVDDMVKQTGFIADSAHNLYVEVKPLALYIDAVKLATLSDRKAMGRLELFQYIHGKLQRPSIGTVDITGMPTWTPSHISYRVGLPLLLEYTHASIKSLPCLPKKNENTLMNEFQLHGKNNEHSSFKDFKDFTVDKKLLSKEAEAMLLCIDPEDPDWGTTKDLEMWDAEKAIFVYRSDGEPVTIREVSKFVAFCSILQKMMLETTTVEARKQFVMEEITPTTYSEFLDCMDDHDSEKHPYTLRKLPPKKKSVGEQKLLAVLGEQKLVKHKRQDELMEEPRTFKAGEEMKIQLQEALQNMSEEDRGRRKRRRTTEKKVNYRC